MCHFGKSINHAHCATQSKCKRGHAHQNMVGPIEISQRPTAVTLLEIDFWISGQVCSFFYPDQAEAYTKAAIKYFARVESQYKDFWQNLVATFRPLFTCEKGTKCGDQVLSKVFVLWFYSNNRIIIRLRGAAKNRQEFKLSQWHAAAAATMFYFAKSR